MDQCKYKRAVKNDDISENPTKYSSILKYCLRNYFVNHHQSNRKVYILARGKVRVWNKKRVARFSWSIQIYCDRYILKMYSNKYIERSVWMAKIPNFLRINRCALGMTLLVVLNGSMYYLCARFTFTFNRTLQNFHILLQLN